MTLIPNECHFEFVAKRRCTQESNNSILNAILINRIAVGKIYRILWVCCALTTNIRWIVVISSASELKRQSGEWTPYRKALISAISVNGHVFWSEYGLMMLIWIAARRRVGVYRVEYALPGTDLWHDIIENDKKWHHWYFCVIFPHMEIYILWIFMSFVLYHFRTWK